LLMAILVGAFAGYGSFAAAAASVTQLNVNDPMTWLVKSVCTNAQNQVVLADPYGGCPAGAGIRKIKSGDALPYHNVEQGGYQQRDALPVSNPIDGSFAASAVSVTQLNVNDPMTWLVKSVCTNAQNQAVLADPYGGCPAGAGIRKIKSGDALPYHNVEQGGYQQRDVFPVSNPIDGKSWVIATYDWSPFNLFNLYNGTDGYDIYSVQNGWASIVNTSDGGGYGQT